MGHANTIVLTAADGMRQELPLQPLLERGAVVASKVNGEDIRASMGSVNQLWVPGLPAKYFVRDIVSIDFEERAEPPQLAPFEDDGHDFTNRPNIAVSGPYSCAVGENLELEGWADDYDRAIAAIELSFDDGASWVRHETSGAAAGRWVYWHFSFTPTVCGPSQVIVRAVNELGERSPIAAIHRFDVV